MSTDPNVRTRDPKPQDSSKPPETVPAPDLKRMSVNAPGKDKRPDDWE